MKENLTKTQIKELERLRAILFMERATLDPTEIYTAWIGREVLGRHHMRQDTISALVRKGYLEERIGEEGSEVRFARRP